MRAACIARTHERRSVVWKDSRARNDGRQLLRRMLLGAVSVVQTPRLRVFETKERRVAKFSETMDPCFVGRNAAVLQYTRFA